MKYTVVLLKDDKQVGKYKLDEDMFNDYKKQLEPYISLPIPSKPVICIETGEIFKNVHRAAEWVIINELSNSYSADDCIRKACQGKKEKAYGYSWKYL